MTQYRKSIFDLGRGPGLAVPDPRDELALAVQRANREAQAQAFSQDVTRAELAAGARREAADQDRGRRSLALAAAQGQAQQQAQQDELGAGLLREVLRQRGDLEQARLRGDAQQQDLAGRIFQSLSQSQAADDRAAADRQARQDVAELNARTRRASSQLQTGQKAAQEWNRAQERRASEDEHAGDKRKENLQALVLNNPSFQKLQLAIESGKNSDELVNEARRVANQILAGAGGDPDLLREAINSISPTLMKLDRARDQAEPGAGSWLLSHTLGLLPAALSNVEDWLTPNSIEVPAKARLQSLQLGAIQEGTNPMAELLASAERAQREARVRQLLDRAAWAGNYSDPRAQATADQLGSEIARLRSSLQAGP